MAQLWEYSPPTNVAWVRFPDSASYVGWVCCWFSSLLRGFFSWFSSFPLSTKTNISKFQFDPEKMERRATLLKPLKFTFYFFIYVYPCPLNFIALFCFILFHYLPLYPCYLNSSCHISKAVQSHLCLKTNVVHAWLNYTVHKSNYK